MCVPYRPLLGSYPRPSVHFSEVRDQRDGLAIGMGRLNS